MLRLQVSMWKEYTWCDEMVAHAGGGGFTINPPSATSLGSDFAFLFFLLQVVTESRTLMCLPWVVKVTL
jgi:hypothetical protein